MLIKDNVLMNNIETINFLKNEITEPKALNIDYDTFLNLKDNLDFTSFEYLKLYSYNGNEVLKKCNNEYHYSDIEYWKMTPKKLFFNFGFFSESLYRHSIFNKMFFVDKDGYFRQTPLGKILFYYQELNENTLSDINTWEIIKNQCDVCMDCEYRHMCIDARLPTIQKEYIWYFDTECNYNPYICEWKGSKNWISVKQWREQNPEWKNYQKP